MHFLFYMHFLLTYIELSEFADVSAPGISITSVKNSLYVGHLFRSKPNRTDLLIQSWNADPCRTERCRPQHLTETQTQSAPISQLIALNKLRLKLCVLPNAVFATFSHLLSDRDRCKLLYSPCGES